MADVKNTISHLNPLIQTAGFGQSLWLDYIRRDLLKQGGLKKLVEEDALKGLTSNPAIFEKAFSGSPDYQESLKKHALEPGIDAKALYEAVAIEDIQDAAELLRPVYEKTQKRDGYVSLEVSPYLALDTEGTLEEARRLWTKVNRPNLMIKVPATPEGIPAIERLISEGINVNVTLLFAQSAYEKVAEAYISGLEKWVAGGGDAGRVASVASFFVSRIDVKADALLSALEKKNPSAGASALKGKVAIANAKLAYQSFLKLSASDRWKKLEQKGAQPQRLLWASTGTKNPEFRDTIYIEELIGPQTVNTVPPATLDAFRDHGKARASLGEGAPAAQQVLANFEKLGISLKEITDQLLTEGVILFSDAFDQLLGAVEKKRREYSGARLNTQAFALAPVHKAAVDASLKDWRSTGKVRKLWAGDASLWTGSDEAKWLAWMGDAPARGVLLAELKELQFSVKNEALRDLVVLGMGGSSLCPEVLAQTYGQLAGFPRLHILDSTDPAQILALEKKIDLARTWFIVSSKSGSTLEPNIFKQYFFEKVKAAVGSDRAGSRFLAVTDPGSKMQAVAEKDHFRKVYAGVPGIGGRYSALSNFGMVPAAAMGLDVEKFLARAESMRIACGASVPAEENPGVALGVVLGTLALQHVDKVTVITSAGISDLGAWLEQLLAESLGKNGKGLIPVDREPIGSPENYAKDRLFVHLQLVSDSNAANAQKIEALEKAGHPIARIELADSYGLSQEFMRWEIAAAVAGSLLGVHPFNQPDVEASKDATRRLTEEVEKKGTLPSEKADLTEGGLGLFTKSPVKSLQEALTHQLAKLKSGDYFAILAYLEMSEENTRILQDIRLRIRDARKVATCLEFGPRFLHSTGQDYKGGPDTGVYLQLTCDDAQDFPVPGQKYTFGTVKAAQARGDLEVLLERGRRTLRIHLGKDVKAGLQVLRTAFEKSLEVSK